MKLISAKTTIIPLQLCKIEWAYTNNPTNIKGRHYQRDFEIIWIQEGNGIHIINGERYQMGPNSVYAALPGRQHELNFHSNTRGYIVSFDSSQLARSDNDYLIADESYLHQYFSKSPVLLLEDEQVDQIGDLIVLLEKESYNHFVLRGEIIGKYLQLLQLYLRRNIETLSARPSISKRSSLLNQYLWLLEKNFKTKKSVLDYAKELHVSPNYLNNVVKRSSGYSASYHIRQRLILEAKRKALHSGYSMKEIAYYLGFHDMAHFSKFFKSMCGMSFTEFKRTEAASLLQTAIE